MRIVVGGVLALAALLGAAPASAAPVLLSAPEVRGAPILGTTLTTTDGTWFPEPASVTYHWWRCEQLIDGPGTCSRRPEVTSDVVADREDQGMELEAEVRACDAAGGCRSTYSANRIAFANVKPDPIRPPEVELVSGVGMRPGDDVRGFTGYYAGARIQRAAQWEREAVDGSWVAIDGATSEARYTLTALDVGRRLRMVVRAFNEVGETMQVSQPLGGIRPPLPTVIAPPVITGAAEEDATLTASTGTWDTPAPLTFTWAWFECRAGTCSQNGSSSGPTFVPGRTGIGATIKVRVRAHDGGGSVTSDSAETAVVTPVPLDRRPGLPGESFIAPRVTSSTLSRTRRGLQLRLACDKACSVDASVSRAGRRLGRLRAPRAARSHVLGLALPARTRATLRRSKARVTVTVDARSTLGFLRRVVRTFDVRR